MYKISNQAIILVCGGVQKSITQEQKEKELAHIAGLMGAGVSLMILGFNLVLS